MKRMFQLTHAALLVVAASAASAQLACAPSGANGLSVAQRRLCEEQTEAASKSQSKEEMRFWQANVKNKASVAQCTASLGPTSSPSEMSSAMACLASSPWAGQAHVSSFSKQHKQRIDQLAASGEAPALSRELDALVERKRPLYWMISRQDGSRTYLMVANEYVMGGLGYAYDLAPLDIKLVAVFKHFTTNETIPLSEFRSLTYSGNRNSATIGMMEVNGQFKDERYNEHFPFRHYVTPDGKAWSALSSASGSVYAMLGKEMRKTNDGTLDLSVDGLKGMTLKLVDEATAQRFISEVNAGVADVKQAQEAEAAQEMAAREAITAKLKGAAKGDEDSCEAKGVDDRSVAKCQLLGASLPLGDIKSAGWIVTNASQVEQSYLLTIRKAR